MVEEVDEQGDPTADKPRSKREMSTIEFPYSDLASAVALAQVLNDRSGGSSDDDQLAAWMGNSAGGGTFRARLSASRMFGFIETRSGTVSLTDLGRRALDANDGKGALVEAFLNVPLYSAMYERFRGHALPPPAAIERQMVTLGVGEKQKDRARQVFGKSALYAGYIDAQTGRFIKPSVVTASPRIDQPSENSEKVLKVGDGGDTPYHPFIVGLLKTLPPPETDWAVADRAKWLQTAASIFGLIYKGDGSVKVEAQP